MSELMSDMDRAAAAYWMKVALAGGSDAAAAVSNAQRLVVEARAERRLPDTNQAPTLDQIEAPPIRHRP
ncbi:MAG: hypothetical protein ACRELF_17175 [Gemmataceae bacterium]